MVNLFPCARARVCAHNFEFMLRRVLFGIKLYSVRVRRIGMLTTPDSGAGLKLHTFYAVMKALANRHIQPQNNTTATIKKCCALAFRVNTNVFFCVAVRPRQSPDLVVLIMLHPDENAG